MTHPPGPESCPGRASRLLESVTMTRFLSRLGAALLLAALGAAAARQSPRHDLTVFAASSLTDAFTALAHAFEAANPGAHVSLDFAASSTLATQILQGAPADVFASADRAQMARITDAGLQQGSPAPFAGNRLVVVVPAGSSIKDVKDLARPGVLLVLAAQQVPAGHYADAMLAAAAAQPGYGPAFVQAVHANVVSREPNVRQTAAKVALGAADAAVVYATDARGLPDVRSIPIPAALQPAIAYPLVALRSGADPSGAAAFRAFVLSPAGRATLAAYGFAPPP